MLEIFYLHWSLKEPENKSCWSSLWPLRNHLASIIFHFATTYSYTWIVQLGIVKKKMEETITFVPISIRISEPFVQNMIITFYKTVFIFMGYWSICSVSNLLFCSLESIGYCPKGMCSRPQSNAGKQTRHTLNKASQASQMRVMAHVRQRNSWLQDFPVCWQEVKYWIQAHVMWRM